MSTPFSDVTVIAYSDASSYFNKSSNDAYMMVSCFNCEGSQMAVIGYSAQRRWLRCVNCSHAMVMNDGQPSPAALPLSMPKGVVGREAEVWQEARECLAVGAYTAAVMLCRKLLLHIAVAHGLAEADDKGRSPNFDTSVRHLVAEGVVTERMEPWIDRIREIGNGANHELEAITQGQADDVARFTEQLLRLAYEMDALMAAPGED